MPEAGRARTFGGCVCLAAWSAKQPESCASREFHGCEDNFPPCDGDDGGVRGATWCTIDPDILCEGTPYATNYDHCLPRNAADLVSDCVGQWGEWSRCSVDCGNGVQRRQYVVSVHAYNGGAECSAGHGELDTKACRSSPCVVDCVGSWGAWGVCTNTCGGGQRERAYQVDTQPNTLGLACPADAAVGQTEPCNVEPCPIDCAGDWSAWSDCSKVCGGGSRNRAYTVAVTAVGTGLVCPADLTQTATCSTASCAEAGEKQARDCEGNWGDWGVCDAECGEGQQTRTYRITAAPADGGAVCPTVTYESQPCTAVGGSCDANCEGGAHEAPSVRG